MGMFDFLKRRKDDSEHVELQPEQAEMPEGPMDRVTIRVENLGGINDVERMEKLLKEGNILFMKVSELQKRDLGQFKQSIQMLKRRAIQFGWDIVGIEDGYIVMTPKFAKIIR